MRSCNDPRRSAENNRTKITLSITGSERHIRLDSEIDMVLVGGDDVRLTLPFQPLAGKEITVSATGNGAVVETGCRCGCHSDGDRDDCDQLFAPEDVTPLTEVSVPAGTNRRFVYHPGDACDCGGTGVWVFNDAPTVTPPVPQ